MLSLLKREEVTDERYAIRPYRFWGKSGIIENKLLVVSC